MLWAAAMFAWFFLAALYLQQVLGYGAARRSGSRSCPPAWCGGLLALHLSRPAGDGLRHPAAADRWASRWPRSARRCSPACRSTANYLTDVLPAMVLLGVGAGIAFNPVLLAAMGDVEPHEAGLASGVVNTSFMMGGALGLAVLASAAASRIDSVGRSIKTVSIDGNVHSLVEHVDSENYF